MKATKEQLTWLWCGVHAAGRPEVYFEFLEEKYSRSPRAYHTLEHIGWGLDRIDKIVDQHPVNSHTYFRICWAMWFHDVVMHFDEDRDLDEGFSAAVSSKVAREVGLSLVFHQNTRRLILATAHTVEPDHLDEQILVDADLSILGADQSAFDNYESLIRQEWAHVPEETFRAGRIAVLTRFQNKRRIFSTDYGFNRWERKARFNIGQSLARLGA
jgi:predicted metal-dependent HD superfamily phosphohydrolase